MRFYLLFVFILTNFAVQAQNIIDWDGIYQLELSDFQSPATELGNESMISVNTGGHIEFAFAMSNAEFMFTKNFNPKVSCTFKRDVASLIASDSATALKLVQFAQYDFDLSELYARKTRQQLYLTKGMFSSSTFFQPIFDRIQKEYLERLTGAWKETKLGMEIEKLEHLHTQVKVEIEELADFCKTCKPPKKKK